MTERLRLAVLALLMPLLADAAAAEELNAVSVREVEKGVYAVRARFDVPVSEAVVREVLTDYANIPRFLPDIRRSVVRARADGRTQVEQEAVSRFMVFSKKVHLLLDIREEGATLRFRDGCGTSFHRYEGSWTVTPAAGGATLVYELTAAPAFAVPGALVGRVLSRDADRMITHLRAEFMRREQIQSDRLHAQERREP